MGAMMNVVLRNNLMLSGLYGFIIEKNNCPHFWSETFRTSFLYNEVNLMVRQNQIAFGTCGFVM